MEKPLVVVESPTKIKTLQKYLGSQYNIAATVGHIKDLPKKDTGIDIDAGFKIDYQVIPGKQKVITGLKKAAGSAEDIYLAPDPDREGEAIAWHTAEILKKKGRKFYRVLFHELTQKAVISAISAPKELDKNKYEAQKARRILDRLVGYEVSPILWKKVKSGLSAGRVQSVAVRIICERELAIQSFEPEEYWTITAFLQGDEPPEFTAKLVKKSGKKIKIPDKKTSDNILALLKDETFTVKQVNKKTIKRNPLPPFITSKMQQESIRKLRFSAKKTMNLAQQLYEGIDVGSGSPEGLITYMRTDSTRIAAEAALEAINFVSLEFGENFAVKKPRFFKNKKKTQDAHEAIRPTDVYKTPQKLAKYLSKDQLTLYTLIWKRFVASQMAEALIDQVSVSIFAGAFEFAASGSKVKFPGFMTLYMSTEQEINNAEDEQNPNLPKLTPNQTLLPVKIEPKQHFTAPPPRFSEASLVKELEENGIGRPSTYAAILSTIRDKGYVEMLNRSFKPTELGFIVTQLLAENFSEVFNIDFTAKMEEGLDKVEEAKIDLLKLLSSFYSKFKKDIDTASKDMLSMRGVGFPTEIKCPECKQGVLNIRVGKNGEFLSCNRYPDCKYASGYKRDEKGKIQIIERPKETESDKTCPKCGKPMVIKHGAYGAFLGCSGYPNCKTTQSIAGESAGNINIKCPECDGSIVQKRSKRGKIFYGCNNYPKCSFATWDKPVDIKCPLCSAPFLLEKTTKKKGTFLTCKEKGCGYKKAVI